MTFFNQTAVEKQLLYVSIVPFVYVVVMLFTVRLSTLIGGITANAVRAIHMLVDGIERQTIPLSDHLNDFLFCEIQQRIKTR